MVVPGNGGPGMKRNDRLTCRRSGPVFLNRDGGRLSEPTVWRFIRRLARTAGIPAADRLSPHSLRHSTITAALNAGVPFRDVPFRDVQDFTGHADPRTTRRYDRSGTYALASRLGRDEDNPGG